MRSLISLCFLLLVLLIPLQGHSRDGPADQEEMAVLSAIDLAVSIDLTVISLVNNNITDMIFISSAAAPAPAPSVELFSKTRAFIVANNIVPVFIRADVEPMFKNLRRYDVLKEPHSARI